MRAGTPSTSPHLQRLSVLSSWLWARDEWMAGPDALTWKANWPEKSYMPQECMRLRVLRHGFRTQHALSSDGADPTIGQGGCHDTADSGSLPQSTAVEAEAER